MNLKDLLTSSATDLDRPFYEFNREERHLAGVLFYLLNQPGLLRRMFDAFRIDWNIDSQTFGIYLEYSYPRDLWHAANKTADSGMVVERKRNAILTLLKARAEFAPAFSLVTRNDLSIKDFNAFFIEEHRASHDYVQSPANWNLKRLAENLTDNDALASACMLKWAFRAKPDIVIHPDNHHALCLELKLESVEGTYPATRAERKVLHDRGLYGPGQLSRFPTRQTVLQHFLMTELLGFDCRFKLVTRHETDAENSLSWSKLIESLSPLPELPLYMQAALRNAGYDHIAPPGLVN